MCRFAAIGFGGGRWARAVAWRDMETENKIIFVMALLMAIGSGVGMFYNYSLVLFFACGLSLLYAIHKEERK